MKDYRLSEIQNHNFNELWALSDDIAKRRLEFEFLRKAQYSLEHLDIEPRDMIELPCKEHFVYKHDDGHITENWRVFYRAEFALIGTAVFPTEPEADAFLADLKGGKR